MIVGDALRNIRAMNGMPRAGRLAALVALGLIAAVLEMVGIGLVFPLVAAIGDPAIVERIPGFEIVKSQLGITTHTDLLLSLSIILAVTFLTRSIYMVMFTYIQARAVARWQQSMAETLFATYTRAPFIFHLQTNTATLIRNINILAINAYGRTMSNLLSLAIDGMIICALAVLLLLVQPLPTLVAGSVLLLLVGGQVFIFRGIQGRLGAAGNNIARLQIKALQQAFMAVKELKVFGREPQARNDFGDIQHKRASVIWQQQFIARLPSIITEAAMVLSVIGMLIALIVSGAGTGEMMASLALLAAAAFRLLPLANKVVGALGTLHNTKPGISLLLTELDVPWRSQASFKSHEPMDFLSSIKLEGVSYEYPDGEHAALSGITLEIKRGESIGLMGSSGAGKSTLADIVLGLLPPESGRLLVDGEDVAANIRGWQANVGYVPQDIFICDDTVRANIAFFVPKEAIDDKKVWEALSLAQLDDFVRNMPEGLDTVLRERGERLSGGQKQRIGIARALYHNPRVLVLDEATSALDAQTESDVSHAIDALAGQKTLIIIAHRLSTLKHCNRLVLMKGGQIISEGTFDELSRDNLDFNELLKLAEVKTNDSSSADEIS